MNTSYGNFKEICTINNYPFNSFKDSYQNNGKKINPKNNTYSLYKNWYCKVRD